MARLYGWKAYHTYDSRRSEPGFPDLVLCKDGVVIFAELKTPRGVVSPDQRAWLDALGKSPCRTVVWTVPDDMDEIERTLRGS